MFKSYYVVWKRDVVVFGTFTDTKFKSYYVVWKLFFHILILKFEKLFKSYYVVWKLDNNVPSPLAGHSV